MTGLRSPRGKQAATSRPLVTPHSGNEVRVTAADEYMTRDQVAARLKIAPKTLSNWHHLGKGPKCFRLAGGRFRYLAADVLAWEQKQSEMSS